MQLKESSQSVVAVWQMYKCNVLPVYLILNIVCYTLPTQILLDLKRRVTMLSLLFSSFFRAIPSGRYRFPYIYGKKAFLWKVRQIEFSRTKNGHEIINTASSCQGDYFIGQLAVAQPTVMLLIPLAMSFFTIIMLVLYSMCCSQC